MIELLILIFRKNSKENPDLLHSDLEPLYPLGLDNHFTIF